MHLIIFTTGFWEAGIVSCYYQSSCTHMLYSAKRFINAPTQTLIPHFLLLVSLWVYIVIWILKISRAARFLIPAYPHVFNWAFNGSRICSRINRYFWIIWYNVIAGSLHTLSQAIPPGLRRIAVLWWDIRRILRLMDLNTIRNFFSFGLVKF